MSRANRKNFEEIAKKIQIVAMALQYNKNKLLLGRLKRFIHGKIQSNKKAILFIGALKIKNLLQKMYLICLSCTHDSGVVWID